MNVTLRWITPDAERQIVDIARVSSDPAKAKAPDADLIRYLLRNKHVSPFEHASACVEIEGASRAVTRQILRHRAFHFQEFSQRYQVAGLAGDAILTPARMQHPTNRQASVPCEDDALAQWWLDRQRECAELAQEVYEAALSRGIAKEVARVVLPEGMTPTRLLMTGTVRDWLHYCALRRGNGTQPEHREIAEAIWQTLRAELPTITSAWEGMA